jgi:hypothetical protein
MDDRDIRTYLGQPDPNNDNHNAEKSMMSFMHDQNGYNTYGTNSNREWSMMKFYTARWYVSGVTLHANVNNTVLLEVLQCANGFMLKVTKICSFITAM